MNLDALIDRFVKEELLLRPMGTVPMLRRFAERLAEEGHLKINDRVSVKPLDRQTVDRATKRLRAILFTTGTHDTEKLVQSFMCLGHETKVIRYDVPNLNVAEIVDRKRPDVAIYIGAIREFHNQFVPSTDTLARANSFAPMIHICSDAGDPPWWPLLREYHDAGAFRVQVGIDGCHDTPLTEFGLVELTPIDPDYFADADWGSRIYDCGFAGGGGHHRKQLLDFLKAHGAVEHLSGYSVKFEFVCAFYTLCRYVVNDSLTGSGARRHVKGRVLEAALAGAALIEAEGSPTSEWFTSGEDFLTWSTPQDALSHIRSNLPEHALMARRLRAKVLERHAAVPFWSRTLEAAGLGTL